MTAAQFEDLRVDEAAEVLAWRFDALCRSGYDLDAAAVLAANVEVDLHDAVELVARGCSPEPPSYSRSRSTGPRTPVAQSPRLRPPAIC